MNRLSLFKKLFFKSGVSFTSRAKAFADYRRRIKEWRKCEDWSNRVKDAVLCPDNKNISRVSSAGSQDGRWIVMHNGLKVSLDGYYGEGLTQILTANRGVHEPQEEYIFNMILERLPNNPVMLELGAYWGFYSMCLKQARPEARCILLEGEQSHIEVGKDNFNFNNFEGEFLHAFIGAKSDPSSSPPVLTIDQLLERKRIAHLDILHADIQGNELKMLNGAESTLRKKSIDFVFISTHANILHYQCRELLQRASYHIVADVDLLDTYSFDGLLVAQREEVAPSHQVKISLRSRDFSRQTRD